MYERVNWQLAFLVGRKTFRAIALLYKIYKIKDRYPEEFNKWVNNVGYEHKVEVCIKHYLNQYMGDNGIGH